MCTEVEFTEHKHEQALLVWCLLKKNVFAIHICEPTKAQEEECFWILSKNLVFGVNFLCEVPRFWFLSCEWRLEDQILNFSLFQNLLSFTLKENL